MSELMRNFLIGLCSIIAMLGFAMLLMFFGEFELMTNDRYPVSISMNQSGGLRPSSPVELNGVVIGAITEISLDNDSDYPVRVVAEIDRPVNIPLQAQGQVDRSLLAGTAVLQIISRKAEEDDGMDFLPKDGSATLQVTVQSTIEQIMAALEERTRPLLESLERFNRLSDTYTTLGENLNELVIPQDTAALEAGAEPNLRTAVARLNRTLANAEKALQLAGDWLGDEQLQADVRQSVTNAQDLIREATATFERYAQLADSLEGDATTLLERLMPVADELAATLADVRQLMTLATEGEGTMAELLNNPDLYNALDDAAKRLDAALREAQLLMQKVKAEGLPVQF